MSSASTTADVGADQVVHLSRIGREVVELLGPVAVTDVDVVSRHEGLHRALEGRRTAQIRCGLGGAVDLGEQGLVLGPAAARGRSPPAAGQRTAGEG